MYTGMFLKKGLSQLKKEVLHFFTNTYNLIKLFFVEPIPHINVSLLSQQQQLDGKTEDDGFFKFEWESDTHIAAGWHTVQVQYNG